jgi:RNA polymerase sigma-70 factor (ECF subfamily)
VSDDARTDAELLDAASRGDDHAFAVVVRRYVRRGTLLAVQLTGNVDDAEDVVQEAFTVVHRSARTFDARRPFSPWFFAIVRRLATNRRLLDQRRSRLLQRWWRGSEVELSPPDVERASAARVDAEHARRAMEALSAMQRACFELVAVRGLGTDEVAAMHGIAESTVRQHVFRARAALRKSLGEAGDPKEGE